MHELAVCQALLSQVERLTRKNGGERVTRVTVQLGPLCGVEPALLARAFEFARAGSIADGAELSIETAPVRIHCLDCEAESGAAPNRLICPSCGAWRTRLVSGDELALKRLELWTEAAGAPAH